VKGYRVYRDDDQIVEQASTGYVDQTLSPNTSYSYYVEAFDAAGNVSARSSALVVQTQAAAATGGGSGPLLVVPSGTGTSIAVPVGAQPVVENTIGLATGSSGNAIVKVDGTTVSTNGQLDTTYLTNGKHEITVQQGSSSSTRTINVQNKLNPWQNLRNTMLAGFHGNKTLMNNAVEGILAILLVALASAAWAMISFGKLKMMGKART
ncbi:MAG TPA: hypothetical protein VMS08_03695, partial [Candidatus Saccharimonadia bacterium]|nr:hypothetical protein [Candidatus Saccharimonadia bacterium]